MLGVVIVNTGTPDAPHARGRPALDALVMARLGRDGIDTRPFFYPMHMLPTYEQAGDFPCAEAASTSGFNLPSSPLLSRDDVAHIAARVRGHVESANLFDGVRFPRQRPSAQPSMATA